MLPKEDKKMISKIGYYQYSKMKQLNMNLEEYQSYQKKKLEERKLKEKIGYRNFNKMKELGLNYDEYKQYQKEQKLKKYEKKKEKDKIRFKTIRYIERYCNLDMKCQICETKQDVQIHHPNYNEYLKINLLCRKHHNQLHSFELIPPQIIDLENITIKKPTQEEKVKYINAQINNIKNDIMQNKFSYRELEEKYKIAQATIKRYLQKEQNWQQLENMLAETGKLRIIKSKLKHESNSIQQYRLQHKLTAKQLSKLTNISEPTIRAIECGKTDLKRVKTITRERLKKLGIVV